MSDSVFVVLDAAALPPPDDILARAAELGLNFTFDTDWHWNEFEGWLPAKYLDEECGFEIMTDEVANNVQYAVEGRPELQCLLELNIRGGMHSYAAAYAFAGIIADLANGELDLDDDENLVGKDAWNWVTEMLQGIELEINRDESNRVAFSEAKKSGKAPEELLREALHGFVGQKIAWRGVELGFRIDDDSMVFGAACAISRGDEVLIEHGHAARLKDEIFNASTKIIPEATDEQMKVLQDLYETHDVEKEKDDAIRQEAYAIMEQWVDKVTIEAVKLCADRSIVFSLSENYTIRFTVSGISSTIFVIAGGVKFDIGMDDISLTQGA
jgi:hypothetical protein